MDGGSLRAFRLPLFPCVTGKPKEVHKPAPCVPAGPAVLPPGVYRNALLILTECKKGAAGEAGDIAKNILHVIAGNDVRIFDAGFHHDGFGIVQRLLIVGLAEYDSARLLQGDALSEVVFNQGILRPLMDENLRKMAKLSLG